jgi:hypothetical protein
MTLVCLECGAESVGGAVGWRAYMGGGCDGDEVEIGCYCPDCAEREFGPSTGRPADAVDTRE